MGWGVSVGIAGLSPGLSRAFEITAGNSCRGGTPCPALGESLKIVNESQSIFHFSFSIFDLSLPELATRALGSRARDLCNDSPTRRLLLPMTNEKCQMENGKWFDSDAGF